MHLCHSADHGCWPGLLLLHAFTAGASLVLPDQAQQQLLSDARLQLLYTWFHGCTRGVWGRMQEHAADCAQGLESMPERAPLCSPTSVHAQAVKPRAVRTPAAPASKSEPPQPGIPSPPETGDSEAMPPSALKRDSARRSDDKKEAQVQSILVTPRAPLHLSLSTAAAGTSAGCAMGQYSALYKAHQRIALR